MSEMKFGIGQPVRRFEDVRLVTGRGRYQDDITLPRQAYAVFLRSPHAHARILSVDPQAARSAPGVLAPGTEVTPWATTGVDESKGFSRVHADAPIIASASMPKMIKRFTKVTSVIGNLLVEIGVAGLRQYINTSYARRQDAFCRC